MRRVIKIAIAVIVPVAVLCILIAVLVSLSFKSVPDGKLCVVLDGDGHSPDGDKVYKGGSHFIGLGKDYSVALPDKGSPMVSAVQPDEVMIPDREGESNITQTVIAVIKWYVGEENVHAFFRRYGYNSSMTSIDEDFKEDIKVVIKEQTEKVKCQEIIEDKEGYGDPFIPNYTSAIRDYIEENQLPYKLYEDNPVLCLFFYGGCKDY